MGYVICFVMGVYSGVLIMCCLQVSKNCNDGDKD